MPGLENTASTAHMLKHAESLYEVDNRISAKPTSSVAIKVLRQRVEQWRKACREQYGCVLPGLPTKDEVEEYKARYLSPRATHLHNRKQ